MWLWFIVLGILGAMAFVRLSPSDPERWHVDPMVSANQDLVNGVRRRLDGNSATLTALHRIVLETPRTEVVAGSVEDGHVTYVTRSQWMGFPDYTTVKLVGDTLEVWGRLRFGKADIGINKARVDAWLAKLPDA